MFKISVLAKMEEDCARKKLLAIECLLSKLNCVSNHIVIQHLETEKVQVSKQKGVGKVLTSNCSYSGRLV